MTDVNETRAPSGSDAIINRHMARLLSELEDAGCPSIFRDAVKSKLAWLRSDLRADATERVERVRTDRHG
jgi:hypothetical protein